MAIAVVHGYYRFTDIVWEWHKALPNQEDIQPLKALLNHEALVHPDHPLHRPGVDGIELFLGTFPNGEARLLFSSKQIEYLRYWLHAMGLTKEPIPIPNSDYLIQSGDMSTCVPDVYNDGARMKKAVADINKRNKKVKGTNGLLKSRRVNFECVRTHFAAKKGTWLAIDFEDWEFDHTVITEYGWSSIHWENGKEVADKGHFIVEEHKQYTNHKYVQGNRDHYKFGESVSIKLKALKKHVCDLIARLREGGPLYLVFHDPSQDIKCLIEQFDAPISGFSYLMPPEPRDTGIFIVDSAELFGALVGDTEADKRKLEQVCRQLRIPVEYLHNAGNDAHYTMQATREMATGESCDKQRETRWPERSSATQPKVVFSPYEEDEEYSDMEGLFPPAGGQFPVNNVEYDDAGDEFL